MDPLLKSSVSALALLYGLSGLSAIQAFAAANASPVLLAQYDAQYGQPDPYATPELHPSYPSSSGYAPIVVKHHHNHQQANNQMHKHKGRTHVIRAVKHIIGFTAKAPLSVVP